MANVDRPNGFRPVGMIGGGAYNSSAKTYSVDASNATAIFVGDVIALEADGNVAPAAAGSTQLLGVCVGVQVDNDVPATEHPGYLPATTAGNVLVETNPHVVYEAQEDGDTSDLAATDIGTNVDHIAGAGSTTTGRSAHEIDSDTATAAGSAGFRLLEFVNREDNETGDWARWLVSMHESHLKATNGV